MKKGFLIFTAFVLAFMTVPAAYADSMVKLDAVNGLVTLSADPNVEIPVKVTLSDSNVKGQSILNINMNGGVGLKAIANAKVTVNGHEISADNIDKAGSKLAVTLDKNKLDVNSTNKVVVKLDLDIAKVDVVTLELCLNLTADVMLQAQKGEANVKLTGCKDGGDGSDKDGKDDDNKKDDDDDKTGNDDSDGNDNGNDDSGKGTDNGGNNGGTLPNHNSGGQLPKTATPYPTLSLIGSLLLLAGGGTSPLESPEGIRIVFESRLHDAPVSDHPGKIETSPSPSEEGSACSADPSSFHRKPSGF